MHLITHARQGAVLAFLFLASGTVALSDEFNSFLKPLLEQNCVKCHGGEKTKGKVNLKEIDKTADFLAKPALIKELIEAIDFKDMPPEDEEPLSDEQRDRTLLLLKDFMRQAVA
ncbi:MAG: c-type cytochrome, partial [Verrucomicrobiales bacterium]